MRRHAFYKYWVLLLAFVLVSCNSMGSSDETHTAGTSDETHTLAARFVLPDGTPAKEALVSVSERQAVVPALRGRTDSLGRPVLDSLRDGLYSLTVAKSGFVAYVDSVPARGGKLLLPSATDTLDSSLTLCGVVGMEPQDDPRTVTVNVLGTEIWSNVDDAGKFCLEGLASGRYRLRLQTTISQYTTLYPSPIVVAGRSAWIPDTLWLPYTGIPVVRGLRVRNDSATGDLILSWQKIQSNLALDYLVYRDSGNVVNFSNTIFARAEDTVWRDTTAANRLQVQNWKYRVVVRTRSGNIGSWLGAVSGQSVPPQLRLRNALTWTKQAVLGAGTLGILGQKLAMVSQTRNDLNWTISVKTSQDGKVWDSAGIVLPTRRTGQNVQRACGIGAGKIWCFGHSSIGDGVEVRSSENGQDWTLQMLPDSLWPGDAEWAIWGSAQRVSLMTNSGLWLERNPDSTWILRSSNMSVLGYSDSSIWSDGGARRIVQLERPNFQRVISDLGVWPWQESVTLAGQTDTTQWAVAEGRLWFHEESGWTLRDAPIVNQFQVVRDHYIILDSSGVLWSAPIVP